MPAPHRFDPGPERYRSAREIKSNPTDDNDLYAYPNSVAV